MAAGAKAAIKAFFLGGGIDEDESKLKVFSWFPMMSSKKVQSDPKTSTSFEKFDGPKKDRPRFDSASIQVKWIENMTIFSCQKSNFT